MAKKTETKPKNGAEGPLETLKAVYDFMTQNGLDSVEIAEDGAQIKLVRRKAQPTQVAVPVPVAGGARFTPRPPPPRRLRRLRRSIHRPSRPEPR